MVPDKIPSIYNGDKTVIYGMLMEKSDDKEKKVKCKATLTGDIIGKKFKFDIPFELPASKAEEDVTVIHQLAAKQMIQELQDDGEPYENKHKKEIVALSCDGSVVSKYTAYVAVDEAQNKPVSGSMQGYELTADLFGGFGYGATMLGVPTLGFTAASMDMFDAMSGPPPPFVEGSEPPRNSKSLFDPFSSPPLPKLMKHALISPARGDPFSDFFGGVSEGANIGASIPAQTTDDLLGSTDNFSAQPSVLTPLPPKQSDPSFIVGLQQANGSWLLNDQLAGAMSKSVQELKKRCPVSCDVTTVANIWVTLVVIEFLKKKYSSMMDELELVIMKAEQWLSKQVLPAGTKLVVLKDSATKVL